MKEATSMTAKEVTVECPHCDKTTEGYIGDPRGTEVECEHCTQGTQAFKIHPEADIEMH
ncbi:hypothetical protein REH81_05965 [Vibrio rotiferianus]